MKLEKFIVPIKHILPPAIKNMGRDEYETEIRIHPLLKAFWAAIAPVRAEYKPHIIPEGLLNDVMIPRSHNFADPEKLTPADPLYNQIQVNDAVVFPNLWSWTKMAICRITGNNEESVLLKDIKLKQLYDAFICSQQFFELQYAHSMKNKFYPTIGMNFLRPAAASVVHPHFQLLILPIPPPLVALTLQESRKYYKKYRKSFFTAYVERERDGPRWIGEIGNGAEGISWVSPWAPLAGTDEVLFIQDTYSAFPLSEEIWKNLAEGLHKIFVGYHEIGVYSINLIIGSEVYGITNKAFRVFGMIWSRPLRNLDINDRGFPELGFKIALTSRSPENIAADLRKFW